MSTPRSILPPPRPMLWPLRAVASADTMMTMLPDGRRHIGIRHAELKGVTPAMLAWWFGHVEGDMAYAGRRWPRYLVWHPLDHISYRVDRRPANGIVGPGARLHLREAFQRDPNKMLDLTVDVERIDTEAAIISTFVLGLSVVRLVNSFRATANGTLYQTEMTIGSPGWIGRMGFNRVMRARVLAGEIANAWVRHHVEEVGNLEHFLPALFRAEAGADLAPVH